jgi:serine/threonine-protein kinase
MHDVQMIGGPVKDMPKSESYARVEPVEKGWSSDRKYRISAKNGEQWLLRISDISQYERKKAEYVSLEAVAVTGILMSAPVEFGICDGGKSVYQLLSWIEGEDAETALKKMDEGGQYRAGLLAGKTLRKIHFVPAPETQEPWASRFGRKTDFKIKEYLACPLKFEGDHYILEYIRENRHLLVNRPQCFQHGDYHAGNLIIAPGGEIGVIDFNRFDYGDPWEEFNRIVWCAAISPAFATGRIDGYFGGDVPELFFRLLAFYIAGNTLSSIYWAIPFGQRDVDVMMRQAADVLGWFDNMKNVVPDWYLPDFRTAGYE